MNYMFQSFLLGFSAVFVPPMFLPSRELDTDYEPYEDGFARDAKNLQHDWESVGGYLQNAINEYERESSIG